MTSNVHPMLYQMSLSDKLAQMIQIDISLLLNQQGPRLNQSSIDHYITDLHVGSVLNTPPNTDWTTTQWDSNLFLLQNASDIPILYGLDSIHGANYVQDATVTPQPLNIACSFNSSYAYQMGWMAGRDTPAPWLFSPLLGIAVEPYWSRVYETFGEDPLVVGDMATNTIWGIQNATNKAACAKHFVGYSSPKNGHDRDPSWIPRRHLHQYFLPPWKRAIREGEVKTVMTSYTEYDGVPNTMNKEAFSILRNELGFEGVVVTDYEEVYNLFEWHHTARDLKEAISLLLHETSIDIIMAVNDVSQFLQTMEEVVMDHGHLLKRVDESVNRILHLKQSLGLFENTTSPSSSLEQNHEETKQMTRDSIVLVQNVNNTLPLKKNIRILVTGPTANSLEYQCGGWTGAWQGASTSKGASPNYFSYGSTLLQSLNNSKLEVDYTCGVDILGHNCELNSTSSIQTAVNMSHDKDYVIIALGEVSYTEKPGDIRSLELPRGQYDLVHEISKKGDAKIILVYFGGRPRLLSHVADDADAILLAFLPGPHGGDALTDILTGKQNPNAKLAITYPKYDDIGGVPYFHTPSSQCTKEEAGPMPHYQYKQCSVQWPFGHGLSYTSFTIKDVKVSSTVISRKKPMIRISATIENTGSIPGSEVVFFFKFDESRHVTPEYKRLHSYTKVHLKPSKHTKVSTEISLDDLRFIGPHDDTFSILQNNLRFRVGVGTSSVDCRRMGEEDAPFCTDFISVDAGENYIGACDVSCRIWKDSGCDSLKTEKECWKACQEADEAEGWGWNYAHCIQNAMYSHKKDSCFDMTSQCRSIFNRSYIPIPMPTPKVSPINQTTTTSSAVTSSSKHFLSYISVLFAGILAFACVYVMKRKRYWTQVEVQDDLNFEVTNRGYRSPADDRII